MTSSGPAAPPMSPLSSSLLSTLLRVWCAISLGAFTLGAVVTILISAAGAPVAWLPMLLPLAVLVLPVGQVLTILAIPTRWQGRTASGRRTPRRTVTVSDLFGPARPGRTALALILASAWVACLVLVLVVQASETAPLPGAVCPFTVIERGARVCVSAGRAASEQNVLVLVATAIAGMQALSLSGALARRRLAVAG